jgi:hypothetical protein
MSKNKIIYTDKWSGFSETRDVWPFEKSDEALKGCKIKASQEAEFTEENVLAIQDNAVSEDPNFAPELEITIDAKTLTNKSQLNDSQIAIVVNLADDATKRSHQLGRFKLQDFKNGQKLAVPEDVLGEISGLRGLSVSVVAVSQASNARYDLGDRLAEKVFELTPPSETSFSFPIGKIDPDSDDWPADLYPKTTGWFIQWGDTKDVFNYDVANKNVLTVIFNEKVYNNLFHLQKKADASHRLFWSGLSTDIYLEVASVYLNADDISEPAQEQKGFRSKFVRSLQSQWKTASGGRIVSYAELAKEFKNDCSFISRLRALLQDKFGVRKLSDKIHGTD